MENSHIIMEQTGVKNLKKLLMRVHCISTEQALYILNYYGDNNPELALNSLIHGKVLFEVGTNGIGITPKSEYSYQNTLAVWMILKYLDKIDINNIYLAQEPSSIFFLMANDMYEIVVIEPGRERQVAYSLNYRTQTNNELNYIALLSEPEQLDALYEENIKYENLHIVYGLMQGYDKEGMLLVDIMSRE